MRTFILYSKTASTSPFIKDLKKAGRIDILLHSIISALFTSNYFRGDVELHLILMGPPNPPKHINIKYEDGNSISKKDLKKLIEMSLRKAKDNKRIKVHPGVYVDNLSIEEVLDELKGEIFLLDNYGKFIREYEKEKLKDGIFILGDHEGFDKKTKKFLKKNTNRLSLGKRVYFTSQAITIINYELDLLELEE